MLKYELVELKWNCSIPLYRKCQFQFQFRSLENFQFQFQFHPFWFNSNPVPITNWIDPSHADQSLHFGSNHHLQHKRSHQTPMSRANRIKKKAKGRHQACKTKPTYKRLSRMGVQTKDGEERHRTERQQHANVTKTRTLSIGIPYIRGLSDKLTPIFK